MDSLGRVGVRVGEMGLNRGLSMVHLTNRIREITDTIKIKAQIRSSFVGAWVRVWGFRATSRAIAAVISSLIRLNKKRVCMGFYPLVRVRVRVAPKKPVSGLIGARMGI